MGGVASTPTDHSRKVQVISAGYSRTGTLSMSLALAKLLDGPVLHGGTQILMREDDYCRTWSEAFAARNAGDAERTRQRVARATAGFAATADLPPADFMPEMMALYPDARVVLVRRDPDRWWASIAALIARTAPWWLAPLMAPIPGWRFLPEFAREFSASALRLATTTTGEGKNEKEKEKENKSVGPAELVARGGPNILRAHNERVRSLVPPAQLLEMELSEGWEPLCRFLGVPVPDEPFPRVNDAEAADQYATRVLLQAALVWVGILTSAGAAGSLGLWLWRKTWMV
ncbi:hypothetical protein F4809DRAFT_585343 [Biscogniauxia mediterranea]|nr:hypothetical protein F4809DRAFT_585343 [Biscogniauxia mediterranea]